MAAVKTGVAGAGAAAADAVAAGDRYARILFGAKKKDAASAAAAAAVVASVASQRRARASLCLYAQTCIHLEVAASMYKRAHGHECRSLRL